MTGGVATAKDKEYRFHTRYRFPLWLSTMGRTRGMRLTLRSLSRKLRQQCHTSDTVAREELIPFYRQMFELDGAFAVEQTAGLDLDGAELAMLLGDDRDGKRVQMLLEAAEDRETSGHIDPGGLGAFTEADEAEVEDLDEDDGEEAADGKGPAEEPPEEDTQKSLLEF
jgi:hypothetical protein